MRCIMVPGNSVTVTGLDFGTAYSVAVFEYDDSDLYTYLTTSPARGSTVTNSGFPLVCRATVPVGAFIADRNTVPAKVRPDAGLTARAPWLRHTRSQGGFFLAQDVGYALSKTRSAVNTPFRAAGKTRVDGLLQNDFQNFLLCQPHVESRPDVHFQLRLRVSPKPPVPPQ